ncbi:exodeoxyribonuclease VII large subunit [uncultured Thiodictyon sp.]|jgi:exodeoxyribonuclease VII large subunit|uniref:exodeoxyribonuclease VII large subunit n=1 Tax=uncultured Thiodictyon sp. TaxID=1846217 RepID=UPI0025E923E7|nr:exodeoxyribonuclease VII large subunit [uncultured Thiodictyon sp.]
MTPTTPDLALDFTRDIYSVARLASEVRAVLDGSFPSIWVRGEISNLALPASGHCYFSLKDEAAQVRCAMFRAKRLLLGFRPENGQQVLVRARVTLYEARGDFQLVVEHMEPGGEGALRMELERLKRRLAAEGLFAESAKRPLPAFPCQVGLITSPTGAAVHDLLTVLGRRCPALPVLIYPAQVQGTAAAASLVAALTLANQRAECDVLILARGGGSLEDLNAFNDESLARAIRASRIPVVSGVGHEVDTTIADLAADRRGATPSAAAELVAPSAEHLGQRVAALRARLGHLQGRLIEGAGLRLAAVLRQLALLHPAARLESRAQRLDELDRRLAEAMQRHLRGARARLEPRALSLAAVSPARRLGLAAASLDGLRARLHWAQSRALGRLQERLGRALTGLDARSPLATLARGYAIVTRLPDGQILRDPAQAPPGTRIEARLAQGVLHAVVDSPASVNPRRVFGRK